MRARGCAVSLFGIALVDTLFGAELLGLLSRDAVPVVLAAEATLHVFCSVSDIFSFLVRGSLNWGCVFAVLRLLPGGQASEIG